MNGIISFEERVKNPGKGIIDFEYLENNPADIAGVWVYYRTNKEFSDIIDYKLKTNPVFREKFKNCFGNFINNRENNNSNNIAR